MLSKNTPQPSVMPLDREAWKSQLHLSQFVNTYYQCRDLNECIGPIGNLLIIGPGAGLDALVMRWKGYKVTTFDIDETFAPDVLGSCHNMPMFKTGQFDAVIASHVLEHLPLHLLDFALSEISRVGRFAIIYLPVAGRHAQISLKPDIRGKHLGLVMDLFRYWERPSGDRLNFGGGQHYWEVGYRGFRVKDLTKRLTNQFRIIRHYRNWDWLPSYNFVLQSHRMTEESKS
jgi:hypothetical protein